MLNEEQQQIIENSLWVVNTVLKELGLSGNEDLRQEGILYMCKKLETFDPTRGILFTTYAYKNVFLRLRSLNAKQCLKNSVLDELPPDNSHKVLESKNEETSINAKLLLEEIANVCTPKEKQVLALKGCGFTHNEIGEKLGCTQCSVNKTVTRIRKKSFLVAK